MALACGISLLLAVGVGSSPSSDVEASTLEESTQTSAAIEPAEPSIAIWRVEAEDETELYSNGLRVSNEHLVRADKRSYLVMEPGSDRIPSEAAWRHDPAGIVFHTTVSEVSPPLEPANNDLIRTKGRGLLRYVANGKLYNFVIDRFGQVFRIIAEDEVAFHAGYSVWSDESNAYLNLNASFIGVAFETRPEAVDPDAPAESRVTEAQFAAARSLTQMLQADYGIPAENCVTHEMVSVNPDNMRIGHHTDFAGRFPFDAVGLPNNYDLNFSSIAHWGFTYDDDFVEAIGGDLWTGIRRAQATLFAAAGDSGLTPAQYREQRQAAYRKALDGLRAAARSRVGEQISD